MEIKAFRTSQMTNHLICSFFVLFFFPSSLLSSSFTFSFSCSSLHYLPFGRTLSLSFILNVCRFYFMSAFELKPYHIDVFGIKALTNDNGELHPNGVNIRATKRKISLNISLSLYRVANH